MTSRTIQLNFEIHRFELDNELRVVLAPDRRSPAVAVAAYYDVGFRSEPRGRTGFAHLFEHLMFQGSATLEKLEHFRLVTGNGGVFNGSTRNDFTNYYEIMPSNALELALFLEADRMRSIRLTPENLANQVAVVEEEVRVNVLNQPYGGFPWLDLPAALFKTFPNAHNAYGEFADLEAATLEDAARFYETYYTPSNAVLAVAGDFELSTAKRLIKRHYGAISGRPKPPPASTAEPLPKREVRKVRHDPRAPEPAVAIGYRTPDPLTELDDYAAAFLLCHLLTRGEASRLYEQIVRRDRVATSIGGSVGLVSDAFEVRGPSMFQLTAMHTDDKSAEEVIEAIDSVIADLIDKGVDETELDRVKRTDISGYLGGVDGLLHRTLLIAAFEQLRADPWFVNRIPQLLAEVSPERVRSVAETWLRRDRRAVVQLIPGEEPRASKRRR